MANFGILTGTTAADGIIGTIVGLGNIVFGDKDQTAWNRFTQNPFSETMIDIQKWGEQALPMYLSDNYRENQTSGEWWKNITGHTGNFLAEQLKNVGFTAGMVLSSAVVGGIIGSVGKAAQANNIVRNAAKALQAENPLYAAMDIAKVEKAVLRGVKPLNAVEGLSDAVNQLKNVTITTAVANSILSPMAESRFEGIHAYQDRVDQGNAYLENPETQRKIYDAAYNDLLQTYNPDEITQDMLIYQYEQRLGEAKESIEKNARIVNNATAAMNYPILMGRNIALFGKALGSNYGVQRGVWNTLKPYLSAFGGVEARGTVEEAGRIALREGIRPNAKAILEGMSKGERGFRYFKHGFLKPAFVEGNEEMLQKVASEGYGKWADANTFYGFGEQPDKKLDFLSALSTFWNEAMFQYSDIRNYEDFVGGMFIGLVGAPQFRMARKGGQWQSPVTMVGGMAENIREQRRQDATLQSITESINQRLASPEFMSYYQGMNRKNLLEDIKRVALDNNDKFSFENSDQASLISDFIMFDKIGRGQEFREFFQEQVDASNIHKITDPNIKAQKAEEIRTAYRNPEGVGVFDDLTDDEVLNTTHDYLQALNNRIDKIQEISKNLKEVMPAEIPGTSIEELTYLLSMEQDVSNR